MPSGTLVGIHSVRGVCRAHQSADCVRFAQILTTSVSSSKPRAGGEGSRRSRMSHEPTLIDHLTRTSFMMRPATFQSWTYKLPSLSQDEPCVPLKIPSIHCSCGTL
jgi:hypothetical protein